MKYLFTAFLFLTAPYIFAADTADFNGIVDFSVTLDRMEKILSGEQTFDPEKIVILDGAIGSITIADDTGESFLAYAELVKGEWDAAEDLHIYSCYIEFSGPDFSRIVSVKPSTESGMIAPNGKVIIIGKIVSVLENEAGDQTALVEALFARTVQ